MKYTEIDAPSLSVLIAIAEQALDTPTETQTEVISRAKSALHRAEEPTLRRTLRDIERDAIEEFKDRIANYDGSDDDIFEIADSFVPIYNYDLIQLCVEDMSLLLDEPEVGPADSPLQAIQWNVLAAIEAALYDYWREREDDETDDSDDDE